VPAFCLVVALCLLEFHLVFSGVTARQPQNDNTRLTYCKRTNQEYMISVTVAKLRERILKIGKWAFSGG
jgi:hypothetical protein